MIKKCKIKNINIIEDTETIFTNIKDGHKISSIFTTSCFNTYCHESNSCLENQLSKFSNVCSTYFKYKYRKYIIFLSHIFWFYNILAKSLSITFKIIYRLFFNFY